MPRTFRTIDLPVLIAAVAGLLHAAASAYWALGGRALLETVGPWAEDLARDRPLAAGAVLGLIASAKVVAALVPVGLALGRFGRTRLLRRVASVGAGALMVYGGANTAAGVLVLAGVVHPQGGYDQAAMVGHALLWDPLFLVWGAALGLWLWRTRGARDIAAHRV